ncbi:hypothetical protein DICVIV_02672 [Dictyocaulus viviparus]|uniref:Uncharacterized protein n=1 Tax=Dictyocaulus viviparus TaxID=29172 RepID=A0A0D8Y2K6_DICVI|nr:hypothetical protein DICVIV_02672 [Dictyocaulus viviparus]
MDYNYENLLNQIEHEIDQIQIHFKQDEKQILMNIDRLRKPEQRSTTASTPSAIQSFLQHQECPSTTKRGTIAENTPESLVNEIDKQLGGFYGSLELRDGLKEAHTKMNAVLSVLKRVREFVRSQFVRLQIEQLQENIALLQKVFVRMNERMELPDSDEFFNEAISDTGSSEKSGTKKSKEKTASKEKDSSKEKVESEEKNLSKENTTNESAKKS